VCADRYGRPMHMHGHTVWEWAGALVLAALAITVAALRRRGGEEPRRGPSAPARTAPPGPGVRPKVREIWWADVPFEDGPGSKDRPCLVTRVGPRSATVLKITSKFHPELPGVLPLPPGTVGDREHRASWLETHEDREVEFTAFRRRVGVAEPTLWSRVRAAQSARNREESRD
jgi:hypothetical protein